MARPPSRATVRISRARAKAAAGAHGVAEQRGELGLLLGAIEARLAPSSRSSRAGSRIAATSNSIAAPGRLDRTERTSSGSHAIELRGGRTGQLRDSAGAP